MTWTVRALTESAADFHARPVPDGAGRLAWTNRPTGPALVLGSTQPDDVVDAVAAAEAGVEVVRRRSGGGAVLVEPGSQVWLDLVIARGDPLWHDDVGVAMHWVGDLWAGALASLGEPAEVHRGGLRRTAWSDLVCFAGLGPGEVVGRGGAKVVGISQRRTRHWARFQTAALLRWDADLLRSLLRAPAAADHGELARSALGTGLDAETLERAVLDHLP